MEHGYLQDLKQKISHIDNLGILLGHATYCRKNIETSNRRACMHHLEYVLGGTIEERPLSSVGKLSDFPLSRLGCPSVFFSLLAFWAN